MIIKLVLILAVVSILFLTLFGRQTSSKYAWKKIILVLFAILMIFAIVLPELMTDLAHLLGVGRGADLLLYFVAIAFIGSTLSGYMRQTRERDVTYRLARKVALIGAFNRYKIDEKFVEKK